MSRFVLCLIIQQGQPDLFTQPSLGLYAQQEIDPAYSPEKMGFFALI